MGDWIAIPLLGVGCLVGVVLTAVKLPGTWLMVLSAGVYGWATGWERVTLIVMAVLVGAALVGEAIELAASVLTARKAGATRQAAWGGLIGGFVGMFVFSLPMPIIGTIAGAIIGCFVGAAVCELTARRKLSQSTKVGFFSALGYVLGIVAKMMVAFAMAVILLTAVVCSGPSPDGIDTPPESNETTELP